MLSVVLISCKSKDGKTESKPDAVQTSSSEIKSDKPSESTLSDGTEGTEASQSGGLKNDITEEPRIEESTEDETVMSSQAQTSSGNTQSGSADSEHSNSSSNASENDWINADY